MLSLALVLPPVFSIQGAALVLTMVVLIASLVAMRWICRRDRLRRAPLDVFARTTQEELAETGYRALFASPVVFCVILLVVMREGGGVLPGLISGGIAGLTAALGVPHRLQAWVRPDYLKKMDPTKRRLHLEVTRRRNPALIAGVVAPLIFAAVVASGQMEVGYAHEPQQVAAIGFMLGTVQAGLLAWGVQYVQVLHSLQRDAAVRERATVRVDGRR